MQLTCRTGVEPTWRAADSSRSMGTVGMSHAFGGSFMSNPRPPAPGNSAWRGALLWPLLAALLVGGVLVAWLTREHGHDAEPAVQPTESSTSPPAEAPPAAAEAITNSIGLKLVLIPPGRFLMGSPAAEPERGEDELQHEVAITRPFRMGVYEVTQEEYARVMGRNPSWFAPTGNGRDRVEKQDTRRFPVEQVSWQDAEQFCRKLSDLEAEKAAGRTYRLPTEAEWEYACRGGATAAGPFFFRKPSAALSAAQANFNGSFPYGDAAEIAGLGRTAAVGSYAPNGFGLYDLHGNVSEWCQDVYGKDYYRESPKEDPPGPKAVAGSGRVLRGGGWLNFGDNCRAADRDWLVPRQGNNGIGFRVVSPMPSP